MRKFKAFDKKEGVIREVLTIDFQSKTVSLKPLKSDLIYEMSKCGERFNIFIVKNFDDVDILESTGLKDKEGKEIFKGDAYREEVETDTGDFRRYFICTWIKEVGMFSFLAEHELVDYETLGDNSDLIESLNPIFQEDLNRIKIVKNIYTSPELLK